MPDKNKIALFVLGLAAVAVGAYLLLAPKAGPDIAYYADAKDPELVALGQRVYAENCASCHGANREGQPNWRQPLADGGLAAPPHDESGHTWHHPDQLIFAVTKFGGQFNAPADFKSNMPAFENSLTDREILGAIAYIKSLWPPEVRQRQEMITNQMARQAKG